MGVGRPGFVKFRFYKTLDGRGAGKSGARGAVAYAAFRSQDIREAPNKLVFDDRSEHADVQRFMRRLDDSLTRHPASAKAFHLILSLREDQFRAAGMADWREVARQVMRSYEVETKRKLEWIAANHPKPGQPHCHMIVKATYRDELGHQRKLRMTRADVAQIKEIQSRVLEERGLTPQRMHQLDRMRYTPRTSGLGAVTNIISWVQAQIARHRHQQEREEEEMLRRRQQEMEGRER